MLSHLLLVGPSQMEAWLGCTFEDAAFGNLDQAPLGSGGGGVRGGGRRGGGDGTAGGGCGPVSQRLLAEYERRQQDRKDEIEQQQRDKEAEKEAAEAAKSAAKAAEAEGGAEEDADFTNVSGGGNSKALQASEELAQASVPPSLHPSSLYCTSGKPIG